MAAANLEGFKSWYRVKTGREVSDEEARTLDRLVAFAYLLESWAESERDPDRTLEPRKRLDERELNSSREAALVTVPSLSNEKPPASC